MTMWYDYDEKGTMPARTLLRGWVECQTALTNPRLVSDPFLAGLAKESTNNLLFMEGKFHFTLRRILAEYLNVDRVEGLRCELRRWCEDFLESIPRRSVDLVADLAEPLVLKSIFSIMSVGTHHQSRLGELVRDMLGLLDPDQPVEDKRKAINASLRATLIFERDGRAGTATGLHAALETAAADRAIPVKLARATPVVVLHGGYENPLNQLGCLIAWAAADPVRFRKAAAMSTANLFEEILRVFSPVRTVTRLAGPHSGPTGAEYSDKRVWIDLESANRDEDIFIDRMVVDASSRRRHLGFGHGRHACPGARLARLQGELIVETLLAIPANHLRRCSVEWREDLVTRGPKKIALPLP